MRWSVASEDGGDWQEKGKAMEGKVLLVSVRPRWVREIVVGRKTVELRRRSPRLNEPVRALVYETSPAYRLRASCVMGPVRSEHPDMLWDRVGLRSCVSKEEYYSYFRGRKLAYGIEIRDVVEMSSRLTLDWLRREAGFVPPQSWAWASERLLEVIEPFRC